MKLDPSRASDAPSDSHVRTVPEHAAPASARSGRAHGHRCTPVSELMTAAPISAHADTPVRAIRRAFGQRRIRHMPIVDANGRPLGLVRAADLAHPATAGAAEARDVMSAAAIVGPEACTGSAARFMLMTKLDALLVVDPDGRLVGILTDADFLRQIARDAPVRCGAGAAAELDAPL